MHFAYEMVTLSPATARAPRRRRRRRQGARDVGPQGDRRQGRRPARPARGEGARGDRRRATASSTVEDLRRLAREIAIAALRFFMVKTTTTRVLAFDFDEALSFEGDSGPYLQYSLVRAKNIGRKLVAAGLARPRSRRTPCASCAPELFGDDLWDLVHAVARTAEVVEKAARDARALARRPPRARARAAVPRPLPPPPGPARAERRSCGAPRLAVFQVFARGLRALCDLLGVPEPERM